MNNTTHSRFGYTLLELLLALSLSVLVITAIGTATQVYLFSLTRHQNLIEQRQITRGLLNVISNDLRAGIQYKANDYSGLENLVATTQLTVNQGLDQLAALEAGDLDAAANPPEEPASEEDVETEPVIDEEAVAFRPSLVGSSNTIALDISRMPRMDQYNSTEANQTQSDIKTLSYFFSPSAPSNSGSHNSIRLKGDNNGGLYRREVDRAVAAFNQDSGQVSTPDESSELLATEVSQIRFRYFDGEQWLNEWDSTELGGFPPAIEVVIAVDPRRSNPTGRPATHISDNIIVEYRTVVHLPAADIIEPDDELEAF
jgi:type II secretory pathway pseudopilin PulG